MANAQTFWRVAQALPLLITGACAAPLTSAPESFARVANAVHERVGRNVRWTGAVTLDPATEAEIVGLLNGELAAEDAVQLALINSPALQAVFEDLAFTHAEAVTLTTPRNPFVTLLGRFPAGPGAALGEFNFVQDMLDIFLLPARRTQANLDLERARLEITQIVLDTVRTVRTAYHQLQAALQVTNLRRDMLREVQTSSELEELRLKTGQVNDINLALGRATFAQLKLDLAHDELNAVLAYERLVQLLGLDQVPSTWRVPPALPTLPTHELELSGLEALALQQRFDVAASKARVELLREALRIAESTAAVGSVLVGGATSRDAHGLQMVGPTLVLELPIFNRRQGMIEGLRARLRQAQQRAQNLRVQVQSQVRQAQQAVQQARAVVEPYANELMPLRQRITQLSVEKLTTANAGAWDVVLARDTELRTQREWVHAMRDYWLARANLEHAVGASLRAAVQPAAVGH